ncbi:MAG: Cof-type HAD-IIB family hydrolase [Ruminococcus sp.]|nr:Cof-type HAD-IIB family hydrolase [Ruminococcus sp.]
MITVLIFYLSGRGRHIRRLYISDLDGTLLDSNGRVSDFTAESINILIGKGMDFSFATARSVYSAMKITEKISLKIPCILMNGVSVYDPVKKVYIKNEYIPQETARRIIDIFGKNGVRCFLYKIHDDILTAYFTELDSRVMTDFAESRNKEYKKPFVRCESLREVADGETVYINSTGGYEKLLPIKRAVELIEEADCAFYEDTYTGEWFLEIFSHNASKANGIKFLRMNYGFDEVVCFGDNLNDLPMFAESDIKIAVGNAKSELLRTADFITLSNNENGVAEWLNKNYNSKIN